MLDTKRLKAANVLRKAGVTFPERFAERSAKDQAEWLDANMDQLRARTEDARVRKVLSTSKVPAIYPDPAEVVANVWRDPNPKRSLPTSELFAVTSLNPSPVRREIQKACIESWIRLGLRVVAVQHANEIESLKPHFPRVEFVTAKRRHPHKPNVLVNDMVDVIADGDTPAILLNSDIEIRATQEELLAAYRPRRKQFTVGVRRNHSGKGDSEIEQAGIDVFLLTPTMARLLPGLPFCIGSPWWDYWLPHHFAETGYRINVQEEPPIFWHLRHELLWSHDDWAEGRKLFAESYGMPESEAGRVRERLRKTEELWDMITKTPTAIFIKTCPKDHLWLEYCLRSIQRYATDFHEVVIVADESGRDELESWQLTRERVIYVPDPGPNRGYIQQQEIKLQADHYTDCKRILYMDSDCIFTKPCTPLDFCRYGNPLWMRGRYGTVDSADRWQRITEQVIGEPVEWEYMRRQPFLVRRETLQELRAEYPCLIPSMRKMTGTDFSEFNVLGAFAAQRHTDKYTFLDHEREDPERFVRQFWSWGGLTPEIHDEIHHTLA